MDLVDARIADQPPEADLTDRRMSQRQLSGPEV
jgi:hypothetical protein